MSFLNWLVARSGSSLLLLAGCVIFEVGLHYVTHAISFRKNRKRIASLTKLMPRRFLRKIQLDDGTNEVCAQLIKYLHFAPVWLRKQLPTPIKADVKVEFITCTLRERIVCSPFCIPSGIYPTIIYVPAGRFTTLLERFIGFHELGHGGSRGKAQDGNAWAWVFVSGVQGAILGFLLRFEIPSATIMSYIYLLWVTVHFAFLSKVQAECDADRIAILGLHGRFPDREIHTLLDELFSNPLQRTAGSIGDVLERLPWGVECSIRLGSARSVMAALVKSKTLPEQLPFPNRVNIGSALWGILIVFLYGHSSALGRDNLWLWLAAVGLFLVLLAFPLSQAFNWNEQNAINRWSDGLLEQ